MKKPSAGVLVQPCGGGRTFEQHLASLGSSVTPEETKNLMVLEQNIDFAHFTFSMVRSDTFPGKNFQNQLKVSLATATRYLEIVENVVNTSKIQGFSHCIDKDLYRKYTVAALIAYLLSDKNSALLKKTEQYTKYLIEQSDKFHFVFWGHYAEAMNSLAKAEEVKKQNEAEHQRHLNNYEISVHRLWTEVIFKLENVNQEFAFKPKDTTKINSAMEKACTNVYDATLSRTYNQLYKLIYLLVTEYPTMMFRVKTPYSLDTIFYYLTDRFFCEDFTKTTGTPYSTALTRIKTNLRGEKTDNLGVSYVTAADMVDNEMVKMGNNLLTTAYEPQVALLAYRKGLDYLEDQESYAQSKKGKSWVQVQRFAFHFDWIARLTPVMERGAATASNPNPSPSPNAQRAADVFRESEVLPVVDIQLSQAIKNYEQLRNLDDEDLQVWPNQFLNVQEKNTLLKELSTHITQTSYLLNQAAKAFSAASPTTAPQRFNILQTVNYFDVLLEGYNKPANNIGQTVESPQNEGISDISFYYAGLLYRQAFDDIMQRQSVSNPSRRAQALKYGATSLRLFPFDIKHLRNYISLLKQSPQNYLIREIKGYYRTLNTLVTDTNSNEYKFLVDLAPIFDNLESEEYCVQQGLPESTQKVCAQLIELSKKSNAIKLNHENTDPAKNTTLTLLRRLVDQTKPLPL